MAEDQFGYDLDDEEQVAEVSAWARGLFMSVLAHDAEATNEPLRSILRKGPMALYTAMVVVASEAECAILRALGLEAMPAKSFVALVPPDDEEEAADPAARFAGQFIAAYLNNDFDTVEALFWALVEADGMEPVLKAFGALLSHAHRLAHDTVAEEISVANMSDMLGVSDVSDLLGED